MKPSTKRVKLRMDCSSDASSDAELSTGSSTDSDGTSDSSDDDTAYERGRVDISVQRLQSMHAVASNKSRSKSKFAKNGRSKSRIKEALEKPACKCKCKVAMHLLLRVCLAFWFLTKEGQDTVLWTIQTENPGSGTKKDWFIEGLEFEKPCQHLSANTAVCYGMKLTLIGILQPTPLNLCRTSSLQDSMDALDRGWTETAGSM